MAYLLDAGIYKTQQAARCAAVKMHHQKMGAPKKIKIHAVINYFGYMPADYMYAKYPHGAWSVECTC
jgi:hypothetical protein